MHQYPSLITLVVEVGPSCHLFQCPAQGKLTPWIGLIGMMDVYGLLIGLVSQWTLGLDDKRCVARRVWAGRGWVEQANEASVYSDTTLGR